MPKFDPILDWPARPCDELASHMGSPLITLRQVLRRLDNDPALCERLEVEPGTLDVGKLEAMAELLGLAILIPLDLPPLEEELLRALVGHPKPMEFLVERFDRLYYANRFGDSAEACREMILLLMAAAEVAAETDASDRQLESIWCRLVLLRRLQSPDRVDRLRRYFMEFIGKYGLDRVDSICWEKTALTLLAKWDERKERAA